MPPTPDEALEIQIDAWRASLRRRPGMHAADIKIKELEDHLRAQVETLVAAGLATDEAFLVAVKRVGNLDAPSREVTRFKTSNQSTHCDGGPESPRTAR